jgi:hypothetical protein
MHILEVHEWPDPLNDILSTTFVILHGMADIKKCEPNESQASFMYWALPISCMKKLTDPLT